MGDGALGAGWEDLTGDGGVLKSRCKPQLSAAVAGDSPTVGSKVSIHYTISTYLGDDGGTTIIDDTRERGVPLMFILGADEVVSGLDIAVQSMHRGETCEFRVFGSHAAAFLPSAGAVGHLTSRGDGIHMVIEDLQWEAPSPADYARLPPARRLEAAGSEKERGNALVAAGDFLGAVRHFCTVVDLVGPSSGCSTEVAAVGSAGSADTPSAAAVTAMLAAAHNNMAMCLLKSGAPQHALTECQATLALQPDNVKALYRCGLALAEMDRLQDAQTQLAHAL